MRALGLAIVGSSPAGAAGLSIGVDISPHGELVLSPFAVAVLVFLSAVLFWAVLGCGVATGWFAHRWHSRAIGGLPVGSESNPGVPLAATPGAMPGGDEDGGLVQVAGQESLSGEKEEPNVSDSSPSGTKVFRAPRTEGPLRYFVSIAL